MGTIANNILRFILLLFFQVLILKEFKFGWGSQDYVHIFVYPLFIFLLPTNTLRWLQLVLAFGMGIMVDMFYDSPGIHASALVFTAFTRLMVLSSMEPPEKYPLNATLNIQTMGVNWFAVYTAILMFIHLLFYFFVEAFSFAYFFNTLLKIILSWIGSFIFIMIIMFVASITSNKNRRGRVRRI